MREVAWDRLADWKRRSAPLEALKRRQEAEPTVRTRDADLSWDEISSHLRSLGGVCGTIPASPAGKASTRDAFGIEGHRSLAHLRLRWTGKGPRSWSETLSGVGKLRSLFVRTMRERDRERPA